MHASRASVMHLAAQKIRRHRVAGLITQRSQVRILSPRLKKVALTRPNGGSSRIHRS